MILIEAALLHVFWQDSTLLRQDDKSTFTPGLPLLLRRRVDEEMITVVFNRRTAPCVPHVHRQNRVKAGADDSLSLSLLGSIVRSMSSSNILQPILVTCG